MLGKKVTQHNRKTKQHKTTRPRQLFFKTASGGIRTPHDRPLARHTLLPTELPRQLSWLGSNHIYNIKQPKHLNQSITNQINRWTQTWYKGDIHTHSTHTWYLTTLKWEEKAVGAVSGWTVPSENPPLWITHTLSCSNPCLSDITSSSVLAWGGGEGGGRKKVSEVVPGTVCHLLQLTLGSSISRVLSCFEEEK